MSSSVRESIRLIGFGNTDDLGDFARCVVLL